MQKVFKNKVLNEQFHSEGYVTIPVLDEADIDYFQMQFAKFESPEQNTPFYTSHWNSSENYRRQVDAALRQRLSKKALQLFENHKAVYSYFLVKNSDNAGNFAVHQDWSLIDESKFIGITMWCPLIDVNVENGSFHVVKKSHRFVQNIRGSNIELPYEGLQNFIEKDFLTNLPVKAGQAIFFDQRLWHASPPNVSGKIRVSTGLIILPAAAKMLHYFNHPNSPATLIEQYQSDDDLLLKFAFGDEPNLLKNVGSFSYQRQRLTETSFNELYNSFNQVA
jgi:ectoine hydroxylase-related dioxygenase (phytanoyl-CoA dioxygenase family)